MSFKSKFYALIVITWLGACNQQSNIKVKTTYKDVHSNSQTSQAIVTHLDWTAAINFESKTIVANAAWQIENISKGNEIIFDSRDLLIDKIELDNGQPTTYSYTAVTALYMGQGIKVAIQPATKKVTIYYKTSPNAAALQWLLPAQTADKKFPFLFTQSQAILARSWIPCQDGPGIRFTYKATVTVPNHLLALMSAANNPQTLSKVGIYHFEQPRPIPAYLMALAVGNISFSAIDNRTGVYAETGFLPKAAFEFNEMNQLVKTAERLYGNYAWGRFDVLVLPPSFPFGGMENPCLTFATPTVVVGDKSLVSLVAHELAHSWSGNLCTNATWNDFWLNEGFTVYFENRIMEATYGKDYSDMLAYLERQELNATLAELGSKNPDSHLKLNLNYRDPDDGVGDVAYIKGYLFLRMLEEQTERKKWDVFLKNYFKNHAFQAVTTEMFLLDLKTDLFKKNNYKMDTANINAWVYGPDLPANAPEFYPILFKNVDKVIEKYTETQTISKQAVQNWVTQQWIYFINSLPTNITASNMAVIDNQFNFSQSTNSEIVFAWYLKSIKTKYTFAYPYIENFLITIGRRKFLTPLYQEMLNTAEGTAMAKAIYAKAKPNYHYVAITTLDELFRKAK
jgi:leukotriene-A4 hydrolase